MGRFQIYHSYITTHTHAHIQDFDELFIELHVFEIEFP